ncbi:putative cation diffusion facilitator family metal ion transporter [Aspergillus japonicus CBS 114.51]|uniref:Putative cation diffusion facilitator family metal ion transporter n=1 Tax=Aspergillus japonicus CBS 114.51 TaxID=1448312 RepID=A0A8T8WPR4_ASPJA|nr:putative cation diffusion facilitator family metal ion transporter [Aspergillus japonicus CBS 114.51]RAH77582.1 putative cation diffusion facilitator family metal ion transporter [Aspergillus japonicus CBS 114.51]
MALHLTQSQRLQLVILISLSFFIAEISVGFYTRSLALVADAFHYLNDLIGFIVAFTALKISAKTDSPQDLSFGWQRSRLLGAFFNGVFLLALGISIFLQSIERFVSIQVVEQPKLVLIIGCVGLALNLISASFLHEHDHSHSEVLGGTELRTNAESGTAQVFALHDNHRHNNLQPSNKGYDLGMLGVLIHVLGDAANNVGVIISALVIWLTTAPARYYADPAVSMAIAIVILTTSIPLVRSSGKILLESVPSGINLDDIRHDLETIPGVLSVHELHVWRLNQEKALASVHVAIAKETVSEFVQIAQTMSDCFHSYGVHSVTVQPELGSTTPVPATPTGAAGHRGDGPPLCQVKCGTTSCELLTCCG